MGLCLGDEPALLTRKAGSNRRIGAAMACLLVHFPLAIHPQAAGGTSVGGSGSLNVSGKVDEANICIADHVRAADLCFIVSLILAIILSNTVSSSSVSSSQVM